MPTSTKKMSDLAIIRREERLIKAEKRWYNREVKQFMKRANSIKAREAALKERREKFEGTVNTETKFS